MQKVLIVVDMQNDFVTGALGTPEAVEIVPRVTERVAEGIRRGETVFFTRDTHQPEYLQTQEGKKLPVEHCIEGTEGWQIVPALQEYVAGAPVFDKPVFGSEALVTALKETHRKDPIEAITLLGLCTDICVISNALLIKSGLPEVPVAVEAACCAGVTPESHQNALQAMQMCQVEILN